MDLITEIKDAEILDESTLYKREAVRAIIFDENNLIPIIFVSKRNYHKIPGGGIDDGENKEIALAREIKEECGCLAKITGEIGKINEFRSKDNFYQTSYCYLGKTISKGEVGFTEGEIEKGFQLSWMTLDEAIEIFKKDKPIGYHDSFMSPRDLAFLKKAKEMLK
jgi:8-oxo-dGTP pyrophosphatase MutT (NUDIX family)